MFFFFFFFFFFCCFFFFFFFYVSCTLKVACKAFNQIAESLVKTIVKHSEKSNSVTLEEGEVRKAKQRIELQATVLRKERELQDAQESVAHLNEEQNKYEKDLKERQITEL